jgi:2-keto-3-deoxy-L-rhamnonate aldolase RhmA
MSGASSAPRLASFRARLRAGAPLVGTFVKTPHPVVVEVLGLSKLDCVCLDAEHAPFDRAQLDVGVLAARSADLPSLIRIPSASPSEILNALDLGATGVIVPHVADADTARAIADACRYGGPHGRGYAGSTRAAAYATRTMAENLRRANAEVAVVAQIEDAAALPHLDAIAAVDGIDCLFVGRMDLTVSLGAASPQDAVVVDAVEAILAAARRHGRAVGMFTPTTAEALRWRERGASLFLLGSDQQWILQGADALHAAFEPSSPGSTAP